MKTRSRLEEQDIRHRNEISRVTCKITNYNKHRLKTRARDGATYSNRNFEAGAFTITEAWTSLEIHSPLFFINTGIVSCDPPLNGHEKFYIPLSIYQKNKLQDDFLKKMYFDLFNK